MTIERQGPSPQEMGIESGQEDVESQNAELLKKVEVFLDLAEMSKDRNFTIMNTVVEDLQQKIEEARSNRADLSSIKDLDQRVSQLYSEAPMVEIDRCLSEYDDRQEEGQDRINLLSWYFSAREKLNNYQHRISKEDKARIQKRLDQISEDLGIK